MDLYYVSDRQCTLHYREDDSQDSFVIEAPNGSGVFNIEIEKIDPTNFVDGMGIIRNSYTDYFIRLTYHYSSHFMDLWKLLEADEITIPFSFDLQNDIQKKFVLGNSEAVHNFLFDYMIQGQMIDSEMEEHPKGSVSLVFESVDPLKESEIKAMGFYASEE
jgi:hypothetical protein